MADAGQGESDPQPVSSCRAHVGQAATPPWLDSDGLHGYLLGRAVGGGIASASRNTALVPEGEKAPLWARGLRWQVFLGDEDFVARMQGLAASERIGTGTGSLGFTRQQTDCRCSERRGSERQVLCLCWPNPQATHRL